MRRYRVARREKIVRRILTALEQCGAEITREPNPYRAPFEIGLVTPEGDHIQLVVYAFTAKKYNQKGRPADEHRFQVKYGSGTDFKEYHSLYFDRSGAKTTIFLGVGIEEDEGVFVACDPAMHHPTWFSRSIEFKTHHVASARRLGWFNWERERSDVRRKHPRPLASFQAEALLAFTPRNFLQYVHFERLATGLPPGERILLASRMAPGTTPGADSESFRHELERELGYSTDEILDMIDLGARRLRTALRGRVAERHLEDRLRATKGVEDIVCIDRDGQPDFRVTYRGRRAVSIEVKNVRSLKVAGQPQIDFQRTRATKADPVCGRYYKRGQFEILAACLHPITARWEYKFTSTATLRAHPKCPGRLWHHVVVSQDASWTEDLEEVLDRVSRA